MKTDNSPQVAAVRRKLPPIVAGMSKAELDEFRWWLAECLSVDFDTASEDQLTRAATTWIDYNYSMNR